MVSIEMQAYLEASEIIDWQNPEILELARHLASIHQTTEAIAKACFEWVRDEIHHSRDYQMNPVTYRASDVLKYKTGFCFAKSHLLAALLRANQIPDGLCYQRLSMDDPPSPKQVSNDLPCTLHGLNAVFLPNFGWYRIDARGNKKWLLTYFLFITIITISIVYALIQYMDRTVASGKDLPGHGFGEALLLMLICIFFVSGISGIIIKAISLHLK